MIEVDMLWHNDSGRTDHSQNLLEFQFGSGFWICPTRTKTRIFTLEDRYYLNQAVMQAGPKYRRGAKALDRQRLSMDLHYCLSISKWGITCTCHVKGLPLSQKIYCKPWLNQSQLFEWWKALANQVAYFLRISIGSFFTFCCGCQFHAFHV